MNVNVVIVVIMETIRIIAIRITGIEAGMSCHRDEYVNMLSQS